MSTGKLWAQARSDCIAMGRKLFEPRSSADLALGKDISRNILRGPFWIGVVQQNGDWFYDSNGDPYINYWASGRPIGRTYFPVTLLANDGVWDDPGDSFRAFVCE